jgi:predicted amidohydrolase
VNLGVFQFCPTRGEPERNAATLESALRSNTLDLLVAPELAIGGYLYLDRGELAAVAETVPDGPACARLRRACRETGRSIVFGLAERAGDRIYNAAVLLTPDGGVAVYRKAHLFDTETLVFDRAGRSQDLGTAGGASVGLMVCFDWRFPEVARWLAMRGAEVIAHPSNLVAPYCQDAMVTRSLENRVFTVTANRFGTERDRGTTIRFTGRSQIVSPRGERIVTMGDEEEGVRVAAIDPTDARDKRATPRNDLFADRRVDLWDGLLAPREAPAEGRP